MMTFDEAAERVLGVGKRDSELSDEECERLKTLQRGFMEDVNNSSIAGLAIELSHEMAEHFLIALGDPVQVMPNLFMHALAYGVAIGVLMEKQEE